MQRPIQRPRQLVVIARIAPAQEAEEMLIDKVEPEKAMSILAAGISQASQNMPGCSNDKKQCSSGKEFEFAPAPPFSSHGQVKERGPSGKRQSNQSFRQYSQGHARISGIPPPELRWRVQSGEEEIQ